MSDPSQVLVLAGHFVDIVNHVRQTLPPDRLRPDDHVDEKEQGAWEVRFRMKDVATHDLGEVWVHRLNSNLAQIMIVPPQPTPIHEYTREEMIHIMETSQSIQDADMVIEEDQPDLSLRCIIHERLIDGFLTRLEERRAMIKEKEQMDGHIEKAASASDSGHYFYPASKRRDIVRALRQDQAQGKVRNKNTWAQMKYNICGKTLLAYERQFPEEK